MRWSIKGIDIQGEKRKGERRSGWRHRKSRTGVVGSAQGAVANWVKYFWEETRLPEYTAVHQRGVQEDCVKQKL